MLDNVSSAPLKPQQRITILKTFLLPRLTHVLSLSVVHQKPLQSIDYMCRQAVRRWLRLSKDATNAFLHASVSDGGLGIPHLSSRVPLNRKSRLNRHLNSTNTILNWALRDSSSTPFHRLALSNVCINSIPVVDNASAALAWRSTLHQTHDGARLKAAITTAVSFNWIRNPQRIFPRLYIRSIKLRAGVLSTKVRSSRGRPASDPASLQCRGRCMHHESLSHILQHCAITHDARCKRHNDICKRIASTLQRQHIQTLYEPHIPTVSSFIKPDLIIIKDGAAYVLNITICDTDKMSSSYDLKVNKYGNPITDRQILSHLRQTGFAVSRTVHQPIVFNYRGYVFPRSQSHLLSHKLTKRDVSDLCILTMQGSLQTYDTYMRGS